MSVDGAHYVTEDSGAWVYVADVPHHRRVDVSAALEAESIMYRFGAPPLTGDGVASRNTLRLYVTRDDAASARRVMQKNSVHAEAPNSSDRDAEVTRLLCASAVRFPTFAQSVLVYLKAKGVGVAPESGIDMPLLAQVCASMNERHRQKMVLFFGAAFFSLVVYFLRPFIGMSLFLLSTICLGIAHAFRDAKLTSHFRKEQFSRSAVAAAFPATVPADVTDGYPDGEQNVIVYRWFAPFVGAGQEQGGWSFTVDVEKGAADGMGNARTPAPFAEAELYKRILTAIRQLELPNTTAQDIAFVFGEDVRNDRRILPDIHGRPTQRLTADEIRQYREANDRRVRCYPCVRIHDWETQIVISQFIRLSRHGKHLFVELNRYLLTPLREVYRSVDREPPRTLKRSMVVFFRGAFSGPVQAVIAPFVLGALLVEAIREMFGLEERQHRHAVHDNPRFNFGSAQSVRENVSGGSFTRYFQKQDTAMYSKILQDEIMETILAFLEAHNIDISELKEQRTTILNSGIIVNSGNVNATSLAVGAHSKAHAALQHFRPTAQGPTQKPTGATA
jgi:hypothetical protein